MGQIFSHLTNPSVVSPGGQTQVASSMPAAGIALAKQAAQTAGPSTADIGGDLTNPGAATYDNPQPAQPRIIRPPFLQAVNSGPAGMPNALSPSLSKMGKLAVLLTSGVQGALAGRAAQEQTIAESGGRRAGGIGTGFSAGYQLPFMRAMQTQQVERGGLENEMLGQQAQLYPWLAKLGAQKTGSEIQKNLAEGQKAGAEAQAVPTKQALEQAQTEAAFYKDDPNLGLVDIRSGQPMSAAAVAPLTADEAGVLGKQPGERVPLKLKNTASEILNRGIHTVQAGGRSLLVDNKGNTIKDMGAATPVVVNQLGFSQFGQKEGIKSAGEQYNTAMGADERLDRMENAYQKALGGDQQAMLSLLTDHIGMTLGLQKGARITKDILNEAQQSQPWLAGLKSRFDDRGYLSGATLGPDQMRQMLSLGYEARNRAWQTAFNTSQLYGVEEPPNARTVFSKRDPNSRIYEKQTGQGGNRPPLSSFEH